MTNRLRCLVFDEEGLTSIEYALLLALIAIAAIAAWQALGATKAKLTIDSVAKYVGAT